MRVIVLRADSDYRNYAHNKSTPQGEEETMLKFAHAVVLACVLWVNIPLAAAADAKALTDVFDQYNAAVRAAKADNLAPALAFRSAEYRQRSADQRARYPQARQNTLEEMRFFVPLDYVVESVALGVEVAALALMANLKIELAGHPKRGQTIKQ